MESILLSGSGIKLTKKCHKCRKILINPKPHSLFCDTCKILECKYCHKKFISTNKKFCSRICANLGLIKNQEEYKKRRLRPPAKSRARRKLSYMYKCYYCQKRFRTFFKQGYSKTYCGRKCAWLGRLGKNNPYWISMTDEQRNNITKKLRKIWSSKSNEEKEKQIVRFMQAPIFKYGKLPTKFEQLIINLNINGLKYTSRGKNLFSVVFKCGKRKYPDFRYQESNIVVEIGDTDFWHNQGEIQNTINEYNKIGYDCLYLTTKDVLLGKEHIKKSIEEFIYERKHKIN